MAKKQKKKRTRRGQLVCQHLENISRKALEDYMEVIRHFVRGRQGIYALYKGKRLYYVGLASNLRGRLKTHLRDKHKDTWDRFSVYLTIGDKHLRELESLLIRIADPSGNSQTTKFAKSENLTRTFRSLVKVVQKKQLDELCGTPKQRIKGVGSSRAKGKGRTPTLAKYLVRSLVRPPFDIRWKRGAVIHKARVRRDGRIRFGGKLFTSPSVAASPVIKGAVNGWLAWKYERAPGDWVPLDELRKK